MFEAVSNQSSSDSNPISAPAGLCAGREATRCIAISRVGPQPLYRARAASTGGACILIAPALRGGGHRPQFQNLIIGPDMRDDTINSEGQQPASRIATVRIAYDPGARLWFIESSNFPGLSGEAPTSGALIRLIPRKISTIAEANGCEVHVVHILPS